MADAPSGSTNTPSSSTNAPSGSTGAPSISTECEDRLTSKLILLKINPPSGSNNTPSSSTNAPSGSTGAPTISTEYQDRLNRVISHHDWYYPVYSYKVKEGIYSCSILVQDIYFTSDDGRSLAEVKENVAKKAYDYWS